MRWWLTRKKTKLVGDLYAMYFASLLFFYIFLPDNLLAAGVILTLILFYWRFLFGRDFSNRRRGIKTEENSALWLEDALRDCGTVIKKSIKMQYGDIDIYAPEERLVIDVKDFKKIDSRLHDDKLLRSMRRQKAYVSAEVGIFWLPHTRNTGLVKIEEGIFAVGGKTGILQQFPRYLNTRSQDPIVMRCPKCGSNMVERTNKGSGQKFFGCSNYPKCSKTHKP